MALTQVDQGLLGTYAQYTGFKNRIINGAMVINQRAASVTASAYTVDRFEYAASQSSKATISQDTSVYPTGFNASLKVLSSSAYTVGASEIFMVRQSIEGYNIADLGWGTANAQTVTLSFWVRSSLTGTFGGAVENSATDRCYVFSYTINAVDTWEYKTVTIAGDTSGTWLTTTGIGMRVSFSFGAGSSFSGTAGSWGTTRLFAPTGAVSVVGTNGATFYITGVQLEKGSTATSFDYRPYPMELAMCERYYEVMYNDTATVGVWGNAPSSALTTGRGDWFYHVAKRAQPTVALASGASWVGNTATIFPGIDKAHFFSASGYFYSSNTAGTPSLTASAEL